MNKPGKNILIVDDNSVNRSLLQHMITALGYLSIEAENGLEAIKLVREKKPDLVLLDILMPRMDGYQTLELIKKDPSLRDIPVIMISALDEIESVTRCIKIGAEDYLAKPFEPTILRARIDSCLEKKEWRDQEVILRKEIEEYNLRLEERVREQVEKISAGQRETIFAMAKLAESRDPETGEHLERMREYCVILSRELRRQKKYEHVIDDRYIENIASASPLHDIGKVGVPDNVLQKPGKLTPEEFEVMKEHSSLGAETLKRVNEAHPGNAFVSMGIEVAGSHHEKWDGTGYPRGLAGERIPLAGRILALGDVYDALTSKRVYKEAFTHEKSGKIIMEGSGKHFDPDIVEAFKATESEFITVRDRYMDSKIAE